MSQNGSGTLAALTTPTAESAPTVCTVPWCVNSHVGEEPDALVHLGAVENAGPIEVYNQLLEGRATVIVQMGGEYSENLDADEIDHLIITLLQHRREVSAR